MNHMDDVGQTLLNWASAFGTLEMVSVVLFANYYFQVIFTEIAPRQIQIIIGLKFP